MTSGFHLPAQAGIPAHGSLRSHRAMTNNLRGSLEPQDDWRRMNDSVEKKRAQNRVAQRNYRKLYKLPFVPS